MKIQFKHSSSHNSGVEENGNATGTSSSVKNKSLEPTKKESSILSKLRASWSNTLQRVKHSTMKMIGARTHQALKDYDAKKDTTGTSEGKKVSSTPRIVPRHENTSGPFTSNPVDSPDTIYATVVHPSTPLAQRPLPPIPENNPSSEPIYAELDFTPWPNSPGKMKPVIYENLKSVSPGPHVTEPIYAEIKTTSNSTSVNKGKNN